MQRVFGDSAVQLVRYDLGENRMCRNIRTLFNFDPPATDDEVREASLQFVRKLSGFTKPSRANEAAFVRAIERSKRVFAALTASALLLLVSLTVIGSTDPANLSVAQVGNVILPAVPTNNFEQFVIVLMENHDLSDIYGPAPYMTQLADQYAFSQHWASITNPSQPNYIALIGGSTFGVSGDGNHPNLNDPTLVDIIENSGHTWNAIAEGSGSGCSINPDRGEDHFPFLSYTTITGSAARCANLHSGGPTDVVAALNAGTNFIWFTPTDQHNMHDNSVASGDSWLQSWVPGLLTAMGSKHAALFLTYDEGYASPPLVYSGFSGPTAKQAYKSTSSYTHCSLL